MAEKPLVCVTVLPFWSNWCGLMDNVDASLKENTLFFIIRAGMHNEQAGDACGLGSAEAHGYFHTLQTKTLRALITLALHIFQQSAPNHTLLANKITFIFSFGLAELAVKMHPNKLIN